jgi:rhodanese-related sulfurtransferase
MSDPKTYAGDVSPRAAWDHLKTNPQARLVDVPTQPEWSYVGVPDLTETGRQIVLLSWQVFPTMAKNEAFADQIAAQGLTKDTPLYLLCRSGVRSKAAAEFLTQLGYRQCYNIEDGFEGPADPAKHRGTVAGWKASGLPWIQG